MGKKIVSHSGGKHKITGKGGRKSFDLALSAKNLDDYIVEELDGTDMKVPAENPLNINWFACFNVKNKKDNHYASVKYSFEVDVDEGQRIFLAYPNKQGVITAHEMTGNVKNKKLKVELSEGDPAVGGVP